MYMFWGLALGQVQRNNTMQAVQTAVTPTKQQVISTYVAARIAHELATQAAHKAAMNIGAASARMQMDWWKDVPAKYR